MGVLVTGNLGYIGTVFDADTGSGWSRGGRFGQRPLFTLYISAGGEILEVTCYFVTRSPRSGRPCGRGLRHRQAGFEGW